MVMIIQGDVVTCREARVDNGKFHIIHGNFGCQCQSIKQTIKAQIKFISFELLAPWRTPLLGKRRQLTEEIL